MSSLSFPYPAAILIAVLVAALVFHLSRILGPQRLVHAAFAAAAVGLIDLLGSTAFGWRFVGQGALVWVYLALFILAAAVATRRRLTLGAIGLPWLSALIQLGVVAYMFAPESFRKPPVTAALFLYFVFEALVWLRGRQAQEPAQPSDAKDRQRPPLFPPQRRRGVAEVSAAVAAIVIAYLLFVGPPTSKLGPDSATAQHHESQTEPTAVTDETATAEQAPAVGETAANEEPPAAGETAASEEKPAEPAAPEDSANAGSAAKEQPESPPPQLATSEAAPPSAPAAAKDPGVYTARAGDTFKSIAKRLYGTAHKWRALAQANPELKAKKFRAGQLIKLPSPPIP